ncbi:MAG: hypothetical protein RRB13_16530 [bacterium]|nr:hypothetical protein [bacterium]
MLKKLIGTNQDTKKTSDEAGSQIDPGPGGAKPDGGSSGQDCDQFFVDQLNQLLELHYFPISNQLNGLKVLIDYKSLQIKLRKCPEFSDAVGTGAQPKEVSTKIQTSETTRAPKEEPVINDQEDKGTAAAELEGLIERFDDLYEKFQSPLLFTPFYAGVSHTLAGIKYEACVGKSEQSTRWFARAKQLLDKSRNMYTMHEEYYEAIGGLYYFYDDFNDRDIHFHHAIQMAGKELTALLREVLTDKGRSTNQLQA